MTETLKGFVELSHQANQQHFCEKDLSRMDFQKIYDPLKNTEVYRQLSPLEPLLQHYPKSRWVTIGDGKCGKEAFYLQSAGAEVHATDMDIRMLEECKKRGALQSIGQENAESLSFEDDAFDFALCKETLHHLPRPYLAIYEMYRVSRLGFIFIEPTDQSLPASPIHRAIAHLDEKYRETFGLEDPSLFEECGNYAYKFSVREVEKLALGLGLHWFAYKGINVVHMTDMPSYPKGNPDSLTESHPAVQEFIQKQTLADKLCEEEIREWGSYAFLVFNVREVSEELKQNLKTAGWNLKKLPVNPYHHVNQQRAELNAKKHPGN